VLAASARVLDAADRQVTDPRAALVAGVGA
jgi:hypothetical protein